MNVQSSKFSCYVLVCEHRREDGVCCGPQGGGEIREALKQAVKERGLQRQIRVSRVGCLDVCAEGPNVLVTSPCGDRWFSRVTLDDVPALLAAVAAEAASDATTDYVANGEGTAGDASAA